MIRIAIVDDEREILELLFRIIDDTLKREQAQFEITTFLKAEELLSSHREKPFQIIFADLEMPDVDGLHLAEELRKEDQHTLLIFVTNHDELVFQCFQYEVLKRLPGIGTAVGCCFCLSEGVESYLKITAEVQNRVAFPGGR